MFSKSLIQFSFNGQGCVSSLLLDLRPNYGGGNEDNGDLLKNVSFTHCYTQCLWSWSRSPPTHASTRDSWRLMHMSGSVSCGVTALFSWVLVRTVFVVVVVVVPSKSLFPQSCESSGGSMVGLMATSSKRAYAIPRSAAPRAHVAGLCWPVPSQEALRHSSGSVSMCWACVCALPMSEQLRRPGGWPVHCPRWALHLKHLPGPSHSVSLCVPRAPSQVCHDGKLSGFLWTADLRLWPSWLKSSIQDLRKM